MMKNFKQPYLKFSPLFLCLCLLGCEAQIVKVYYLFDISGSFRIKAETGKSPLEESVDKAKQIVMYLADARGIAQQSHQIGYISERVRQVESAYNIEPSSPFEINKSVKPFLKQLDNVLQTPVAMETDIRAGLYKAAEALQDGDPTTIKLIIIFSDLHSDTDNPDRYPLKLNNIRVLAYYVETENRRDHPEWLIEDKQKFANMLDEAGCKKYKLFNISAFNLNQVRSMLESE